jgi:glycosyltransferase involved in cell wall biosynthesis
MSSPEITIVVAAYNAETTLGAELDALEEQTFDGEFEVVVCDNGSSDGTAALTRARAARWPNLRLIDASAVRGPGAARNVGAAAARAPKLAFCDADDIVAPDWVAVMNDALERETFVTGRARRLEFNAPEGSERYFSWGIYRIPFFPYLRSAGAGNMGVRTQAFLEIGGFDEGLLTGEDLDLCWRMQLAGHELTEYPEAVVTVSNRSGLGATIRQTYAYGVGDRRLAHKYALVEAAYLREARAVSESDPTALDGPEPQVEPPADVAPTAGSDAHRSQWVRAVSKLRSVRRLSDVNSAARRASTWLGFRFGRVDRSAPQVLPPRVLPHPEAE